MKEPFECHEWYGCTDADFWACSRCGKTVPISQVPSMSDLQDPSFVDQSCNPEPACTCTGPARDAHDRDCPVRLAHPRVDLGDTPTTGKWPRNRSPMSFGALIPPLRAALDGTPYDGPGIGKFSEAGSWSAQQILSDKGMEKAGIDRSTAVIQVSLHVGIEQGRRLLLQEVEREIRGEIRLQEKGVAPDLADLLKRIKELV